MVDKDLDMVLSSRTHRQQVEPSAISPPRESITPEVENVMTEGEMDYIDGSPDFIPFDSSILASGSTPLPDSNLLSERGRRHFEELELLDKDGNVVEDMQTAWKIHHMARTQLGKNFGHGCPPTPILKRMIESGSANALRSKARRWCCDKQCYLTRKGEAINEDYTEWVEKRLGSFAASSPATEKDETGSVQSDSPFYLCSSDPADFKGAMTAPV